MELLTSVLAATGAGVVMGSWYRFKRKAAWRLLSKKHGLRIENGGFRGSPELQGEIGGLSVRVWVRELEPGVQFTVVDAGKQTLTRPGFERDPRALNALLQRALEQAAHDGSALR